MTCATKHVVVVTLPVEPGDESLEAYIEEDLLKTRVAAKKET